MQRNYYLASTYLRVLRGDPNLITKLQGILGSRLNDVLNAEYVFRNDIETVFLAMAETGLSSWVLRYGHLVSIASHGPLSFAVLSAPNLRSALEVMSDYSVIRSSTYASELRHSSTRVEFVVHDLTGNPLVGRWLIESVLRVTQELIETIMAHPLGDNATLNFTYPEPNYKPELEAFYGLRCNFNAPTNSINIPASWCRIASALSEPQSFQANLQKCRELKLAHQGQHDVVESTRHILLSFFEQRVAGNAQSSSMPTLTSLADRHNTSTRTYARRLSEAGTNYKQLLEETRRTQAQTLLATTHLPIAEVADNLAYQETANFVRAFKNWFNITPTAWRRNPDHE
jgi:AraC-like DNA-binding protein